MSDRKNNNIYIFLNILLFAICLLIQYNGIFSIKISSANPILPLALLVSLSMFTSETAACFTGMAIGIFADSAASTPTGFNTISFMLLSLAVALAVRYLFNNNYRSAVMLCAICSALYFAARWLVMFAFSSELDTSFGYIIYNAFPSTIYTCLFAIPFYFLQKFIKSR